MKKRQKLNLILMMTVLTLFLSGCVRTKTVDGKLVPFGMVWQYLGQPLEHIMNMIAGLFGGVHETNAVGWAIMILTIIVRLVLLPMMVSQQHKSTIQQEKMSMLRPQLEKLQAAAKNAKTPEMQAAASQATMKVYRENNVSMTGGIGCLPLLIQLPIFSGLYAAIRYSTSLANAQFFGISLTKSSAVLAILAFIVYLVQGYLMMLGIPEEQKKMMQTTMWLSPIMILIFSWTTSAGLGLYFFIGGLFAIIQTLIINILRPRIKDNIAKNFVVKNVADDILKNLETEDSKQTSESKIATNKNNEKNTKRNAGKQNKH
ncbi:YidC/Oxa1 family membrane protein insertase [Weissella beninensis]|uniref:Membrane protein insertase YidC n=1 Tax=Periweissella beninensis TaxID=504936 RepID=A0ABT0VIS7_9LACO|nr:membrane protein insertase YidC [Periweissella beninensis]MBM7544227.1 YidC/Oxa1 family membrane protein insertase [Periweissella beninensis]MCM2437566.1 membrane protein insertase YidC [Periweissella beninensis]